MRAETPPSWQDIVRRRPLTPGEEAAVRSALAADPDGPRQFEQEQQLSRLLARLPDAPLPTNFTAQVLVALDRETRRVPRSPAWTWRAATWLLSPRWAAAIAVVLCVSAGVWRQQVVSRGRTAASLTSIAGPVLVAGKAVELPPVEILRDFEPINRLRQLTTQPDLELLLCFQGDPGSP